MKKEELIKVYGYAQLLWGTFKPESQEDKKLMQAQLWFDFLKPYDLKVVYSSMRELAKESDFCNIAKVAKGCQTIMNLRKNEIGENDIFNEISKSINYYKTKENFEKLSPIAKKVVGNPGQLGEWALAEREDFNTVIASNIKRAIRSELTKEQQLESVGIDFIKQIQNQEILQIEKK